MIDYPVVFRCSECTVESPNLELLESHIWSRHLRAFPYRCALCGYPALNHPALVAHFREEHALHQTIEFKRKIGDEIRLREIVASSIVVPVFNNEDDDTFEDELEGGQLVEEDITLEEGLNDTATVGEIGQVAEGQGSMMQDVDWGGMVYLQGRYESNLRYHKDSIDEAEAAELAEQKANFAVQQEIRNQHGVPLMDDVMLGDEGSSYQDVYDGHELLDEGVEYIDEEGNSVYITNEFPMASKASRDAHARVNKTRHIDMIISKVTGSKRRKPLTVYECEDCGKILRYPSKILEHRRIHTGQRPFECRECGQRFTQKGALNSHQRLHTGEKPYACTWDCGKTFVSASAQRLHEKSHSGERPFACSFCGRLFTKRSHCIRHESAVHPTLAGNRASGPMGIDAITGQGDEAVRGIITELIEEVHAERTERGIHNDY